MPRLWVGDACTEHMVDRMDLLTGPDVSGILFAMKRLVWLLRDGDVLVLPRPVSSTFVTYVAGLTGLDVESVHIVSPGTDVLSQRVLHDAEFLGQLREVVDAGWDFLPYVYDRGAAVLGRELGLPVDKDQPFLSQGGGELFNSKVAFRALAAGLGVPIPEGMPCRTSGDLHQTVERLLTTSSAVIVKRDRAVGGHGNFAVTTDPDLPIAGALSTIPVRGPQDLEGVVGAANLTSTHAPLGEVVVEAYHAGCRSVFVEVSCPGHGSDPYLLNTGELRTASNPPVLIGLELPLPSLPGNAQQVLTTHALRLARTMQDLGYVGLVNIDAIVSDTGEVWFNEVNARIGGSTHLHHIAQTLLCEDWARTHVLLSRFQVESPPLQQLLHLLDENGLAWDEDTGQGVIIASEDTTNTGTMEYVVLATEIEAARVIERRLMQVLADEKFSSTRSDTRYVRDDAQAGRMQEEESLVRAQQHESQALS